LKTLHIIRHAKSSWSFDQLDDFSRPVGAIGRKDLALMSKFISDLKEPAPEVFVTSTASRALYTALYLADAWDYPESDIELQPALYHADVEEVIDILTEYDDYQSVAVFGHNPGFTDLVNVVSKKQIANLPTCGYVKCNYDIDHWDQLTSDHMIDVREVFPKDLKPK
jgi:phosphohistidine phosphatase